MSIPPNWFIGIRYTLYIIVTILLAIAILNPSFSEEAGIEEKSVSGVDIVFSRCESFL